VWVELDGAGPPNVASWLGPELEAQIGRFGLSSWQLHLEETYTHDMNWKLVADGVLDILHPKFLHPDSVGKMIQTNTHAWDRYGLHGRLAMARRKLATFGAAPDGSDPRRYVITNFFIYPNSMLVIQPDHLELWTIFPDARSPERCRATIRFLVPDAPRSDEDHAVLARSWDILRTAVTTEDWPMAQSIQVGAQALDGDEQFVYGRSEVPIQHLHRRLAEDLASGGPSEIRLAPIQTL
jgi:phenylpropionate dioxygenase-like ring-hydroxylating dioxygenase large terminal subunit